MIFALSGKVGGDTYLSGGGNRNTMIGIIIAVLFAALVYALCVALGLPSVVGLIAAILVLLAGIPSGGYGLGRRF